MSAHELLRQVKAKSLSVRISKNDPNTARVNWQLADGEFLTVQIPHLPDRHRTRKRGATARENITCAFFARHGNPFTKCLRCRLGQGASDRWLSPGARDVNN